MRSLRRLLHQIVLSRPLTTIYDRVSPTRPLGQRGEREAERFLLRRGMIIVARGYEDKAGEIDLIAIDGETVVFVEVKTRSSDHAGVGFEAVDENKQKKITRTAMAFLKRYKLLEHSARFDVISIEWPESQRNPEITHYENAFEATGQFQLFT